MIHIPREYGSLRFIATVLNFLGWVQIALSILFLLAALALSQIVSSYATRMQQFNWVMVAGSAAVALLPVCIALGLFAAAQTITVVLDIQDNTQRTAEAAELLIAGRANIKEETSPSLV
jgi:hypothetical protein